MIVDESALVGPRESDSLVFSDTIDSPLVVPLDQYRAQVGRTNWILDGLIPATGFVLLSGPSNAGKTFLAMDWAASICTGRPWHGHSAVAGRVIYVPAEPITESRWDAWERARETIAPERFMVWNPDPSVPLPSLADEEDSGLARLTDFIVGSGDVTLVVLDPLADLIEGADENANREMGIVRGNLRRLINQTGVSALLLHHSGHNNSRERGHSALRATVDVQYHITESSGTFTLKELKRRDGPKNEKMRFFFRGIAGTESGILSPSVGPDTTADLTANQRRILEVVRDVFGHRGGTPAAISQYTDIPRSSTYDALKALQAKGFVEPIRLRDKTLWRITDLGEAALGTVSEGVRIRSGDVDTGVQSESPPIGGSDSDRETDRQTGLDELPDPW